MTKTGKNSDVKGDAEDKCYGQNVCCPPHSYVEAVTPGVTTFGDRTCEKVTMVQSGCKDGT